MKVIGAGFGRTGTMSLKIALETLGFDPCYHMTEVFAYPEHTGFWISAWRREPADWEGVLGVYEAAVDWPACTFYEELMERHPDAKVILSVRDPERWYESVRNTIYELSVIVPRHPIYRIGYTFVRLFVFRGPGNINLADEIIWQGTFDGRFEDKDHAIEVFERHNAEVQQRAPENRLLVYDVKSGWGPLCEFLGVEEPDEPFPRTNDTAQMRRRLQGIKAISIVVPTTLTLSVAAALVLLLRRARP
ncbi:MAG: sulfotransferase family protein [Actinomycetota bacterium]|nr:sulfotransferase family protein [Actinomycetota bacterium]